MTNTFGDRTDEFFNLAQQLDSHDSNSTLPRSTHGQKQRFRQGQKSDFFNFANEVSQRTQGTMAKLNDLANYAKSTSLFNDNSERIEELTVSIKEDITQLNQQVDVLKDLLDKSKRGGSGLSAHALEHNGNVLDSLQKTLANTTQQFSDVLRTRTENLKAQQDRRNEFSSSQFGGGYVRRRRNGNGHGNAMEKSSLLSVVGGDGEGGDVVVNFGNGDAINAGNGAQDQLVADPVYLRSRATAIQSIERTTAELGQIFRQLASMITDQGQTVERIDMDVEEANAHVEGAQEQLLRYMHSISSNRALMLKIFAVVVVFVFIFFMLL